MESPAVSKRLRFEIFKRDGFTCQYCGRRPPDVVLEVDHIHPRSAGGTNEEINLTTACEPCNRGKSAKLLGAVRPAVDADLAYLEAQQQTAEIRRFLAIKEERIALQKQVVDWLHDCWITHMPKYSWVPDDRQLARWFDEYDPTDIEEAIRFTARRDHAGLIEQRNRNHTTALVCYISAVLRNWKRDRMSA